jgi:hypothetical protein
VRCMALSAEIDETERATGAVTESTGWVRPHVERNSGCPHHRCQDCGLDELILKEMGVVSEAFESEGMSRFIVMWREDEKRRYRS